jgi:hypothetical protein
MKNLYITQNKRGVTQRITVFPKILVLLSRKMYRPMLLAGGMCVIYHMCPRIPMALN